MLNIQPTILYFGCKGREMKVLKVDMELIEKFKLSWLFCLNLGSMLIMENLGIKYYFPSCGEKLRFEIYAIKHFTMGIAILI